MEATEQNKNNKSKQKALLLAFFLGTFGAHRFYLDRKITGSIQLFITIIFGFIYFNSNILLLNLFWVFIDLALISGKRFKVEWVR